MTPKEFVAQALVHYQAKLDEETERWGVMAISDAPIENNSCKVVEGPATSYRDGGAGGIWEDLSRQSGLKLHVDYAPGDPQMVYGMLCKERTPPKPGDYYELWSIVNQLKNPEGLDDLIEALDLYDGPYKLEEAIGGWGRLISSEEIACCSDQSAVGPRL